MKNEVRAKDTVRRGGMRPEGGARSVGKGARVSVLDNNNDGIL